MSENYTPPPDTRSNAQFRRERFCFVKSFEEFVRKSVDQVPAPLVERHEDRDLVSYARSIKILLSFSSILLIILLMTNWRLFTNATFILAITGIIVSSLGFLYSIYLRTRSRRRHAEHGVVGEISGILGVCLGMRIFEELRGLLDERNIVDDALTSIDGKELFFRSAENYLQLGSLFFGDELAIFNPKAKRLIAEFYYYFKGSRDAFRKLQTWTPTVGLDKDKDKEKLDKIVAKRKRDVLNIIFCLHMCFVRGIEASILLAFSYKTSEENYGIIANVHRLCVDATNNLSKNVQLLSEIEKNDYPSNHVEQQASGDGDTNRQISKEFRYEEEWLKIWVSPNDHNQLSELIENQNVLLHHFRHNKADNKKSSQLPSLSYKESFKFFIDNLVICAAIPECRNSGVNISIVGDSPCRGA